MSVLVNKKTKVICQKKFKKHFKTRIERNFVFLKFFALCIIFDAMNASKSNLNNRLTISTDHEKFLNGMLSQNAVQSITIAMVFVLN